MSSLQISCNASGAGVLTVAVPNTANNYTLTLPTATTTLVGTDATQTLTNKTLTSPTITGATVSSSTISSSTVTSPTIDGTPVMNASVITRGTAVAASSTSVNFTALPSWIKRITIIFQGVSTTGTSNVGIQLGTGATPTYVTTGYASAGNTIAGAAVVSSSYTTLFGLGSGNQAAASIMQGNMVITNITGNTWVFSGTTSQTNTNATHVGNGSLALGAVLTAVRITTVNGTDGFDAGNINIFYE